MHPHRFLLSGPCLALVLALCVGAGRAESFQMEPGFVSLVPGKDLKLRFAIITKAKEEGKLQILMGIYDVNTGVVRFIN